MTPQTPTAHTLARDCAAIRIPSGEPITLAAGTSVYLTQSLGGTFTVQAPGARRPLPHRRERRRRPGAARPLAGDAAGRRRRRPAP